MNAETHNIVRTHRVNTFTQIDNRLIDDPVFYSNGTDGLRAFALIVKLIQKAESWQFYRKNLAKELHTSLKSLDRATAVLKEHGYLAIVPVTTYLTDDGEVQSIHYEWHITEVPSEYPLPVVDGEEEGGVKDDQGVASKLTRGGRQSWLGGGVKDDEHINTNYNKTNYRKTNVESLLSEPAAPTSEKPKDEEDLQLQALVDCYNNARGTLPKVHTLDSKRKTRLRSVIREHGFEEASALIRDATTEVSKNDWWTKKRYNLDNLLSSTHLVKNAELFRDRQERSKADELLPF